jgi:hypothetical protein
MLITKWVASLGSQRSWLPISAMTSPSRARSVTLEPGDSVGVRKSGLRAYIEPCDPSICEYPPQGDDWFYEIKADGYRRSSIAMPARSGFIRVLHRLDRPICDDRGPPVMCSRNAMW